MSIKLTKANVIGEIPVYIGGIDDTTKNKWYSEAYPDLKALGTISKDWIQGLEIVKTKVFLDTALNTSMGMGNRTVTLSTTYVKVEEDYNLVTGYRADDEAGLYVNDELLIITNNHNNFFDVTMPLKKGWNKIESLVRNGTGGDGFLFSTPISQSEVIVEMTYDVNVTKSQSYIEDTKEAELQKISIRPKVVKQNIVGKDMFRKNYEPHPDVEKGIVELLEPTQGGVFRMKYETTARYDKQGGWPSVYAYRPIQNRKLFLFKPNTPYTFTYYVHEASSTRTGYPDIICMTGDGYSHTSETPGLRTATVTSSPNASTGGGLFHIMIASPDTVYDEGERRCFDIELISVVEGTEPQYTPGPYLPMAGTAEGLTVTTQDFAPKLGEYELDGDITGIINNVENIITKKEEELKINWI